MAMYSVPEPLLLTSPPLPIICYLIGGHQGSLPGVHLNLLHLLCPLLLFVILKIIH